MSVIWNRLKYVLSPQLDVYDAIKDVVRGRVADIGFGTGFGTHLLAVNADVVCGLEVDDDAIRFAQKVFPFRNMSFEYGDITDGVAHTGFDFVVMIDVIEHLERPDIALANVRKMLAPGGTLICSTPNRMSRYRKSENHVREFAPSELLETLMQSFTNVALRDYKLEPLTNQFENPILAFCRNGGPTCE